LTGGRPTNLGGISISALQISTATGALPAALNRWLPRVKEWFVDAENRSELLLSGAWHRCGMGEFIHAEAVHINK
jgi:hypothetical protein